METEKRKPDFKGNLEVALWINRDKNGKEYFSIKLGTTANLFENVPKEKPITNPPAYRVR